MLTLAEVLELPVVRRALPEVIVGADALERELRWAHVIEMADPSDLLKGGELVLTTGIGAGTQERDQTRWIATLVDQGPAAVMVELGTTWRERVPDPVVRACTDANVPLVAFQRQVRFIEITEAVHAAVLNRQFELLRRGEEIHRRFTELILQGRGVPEILAELVAAVGSPVVLEDAGHELVYYVSGRVGDDVALQRVGRPAPGRGPRRDARGRAGGRRAADGQLVGAADRAGDRRAARRLRPRRHRARRAGGGDRPARPAARGAPARSLARRVPVRPGRRPGGGSRRAPACGGAGIESRAPRTRCAAAGGGELARAARPAWRGAVVDAAVRRAARGAVLDRVRRAARAARRRPARAARARRPQL